MRSTQKRQETVTFPSHAHLKPHAPRFTEIIYRFKVIREKATNKRELAVIHRMKEKFTTLAAVQRRKNPGPVDSSLKRECSLNRRENVANPSSLEKHRWKRSKRCPRCPGSLFKKCNRRSALDEFQGCQWKLVLSIKSQIWISLTTRPVSHGIYFRIHFSLINSHEVLTTFQ